MKRITKAEWLAIETALNQVLAGEIDGYDPADGEDVAMRRTMTSALAKVQDRAYGPAN